VIPLSTEVTEGDYGRTIWNANKIVAVPEGEVTFNEVESETFT